MIGIDSIANVIKYAVDKTNVPAMTLPGLLLYCTAMKRPGLSATKIAANVITNNAALGIATGTNPDGSPNVINQYTYNVVKEIVQALKDEAVVQTAIPTGSLMIQVNGANAGGPVVSVGTNITNTVVKGIIR